ncbi:MAG: discoidin domain-containing protein, partial [Halobacteriales archaeon]|nr:discoidin domain-containing protein [Halobacteriales archaeon]
TSTLSWSVFGAESVKLDGEPVDSAGTRVVSPLEDTTYTLVAVDAEGEEITAVVTVEVLDPTEINRAVGQPVVASSGEPNSAEIDPNRAVDGDPETRWSSAWENDEWIYVDLGETYDVSLVRLLWEVAYGSEYNIDVSLDGVFWTTVYEEREGDGQTDEIFFDTPVTARYVRMYGLVKATQWGFSLWEFEVYGLISALRPPAAAVTAPHEGAVVRPGSSVTVEAEADDEDGEVLQVDFYLDGGLIGTADTPPYEMTLEDIAEGRYALSAVVTDDDSLRVSSQPNPIYAISTTGFTRYEFEDAELVSNGDMTVQSSVPGASEGEYVDMRDSGTITFDDVLV